MTIKSWQSTVEEDDKLHQGTLHDGVQCIFSPAEPAPAGMSCPTSFMYEPSHQTRVAISVSQVGASQLRLVQEACQQA